MQLYAVIFLTYLKPLILSTIRSYYRNYIDRGSVVSLSGGLKAILKAEHSMLKLKMFKNIRTFADDTTLFYSFNSLQDLEKTINEEFNHLLSYCSANKLSVNFKKTHYMTISSPQKQINLSLIYAILKKRTTSNT